MPFDQAPDSGHMRVTGHLPFRWRTLAEEEVEPVRSAIMDKAVARSWKLRPESHVGISEDLEPVIRRLNELDEKLDRVLKKLDRTSSPELPVRALTLGTEECSVQPVAEESLPAANAWVEIVFRLPPEDDEDVLVLAKSASPGHFSFVFMAQDQIDRLVRYLLNRQRLGSKRS